MKDDEIIVDSEFIDTSNYKKFEDFTKQEQIDFEIISNYINENKSQFFFDGNSLINDVNSEVNGLNFMKRRKRYFKVFKNSKF